MVFLHDEMKKTAYQIGYDKVTKRELLQRLGLQDCMLVEHRWLTPEQQQDSVHIAPEHQVHSILIRYPRRPSEWITFTGMYEIIEREPIPWIESPLEYHLYGTELYPANIRREKAPQARIPARTKLQITAIRDERVYVTVPGHPSRRYEMALEHARFAKSFPTEMELSLQVYAFPPRSDVFVDWLLAQGRKRGYLVKEGERLERTAFDIWNELRCEYDTSTSAALLAVKQALLVLDRSGSEIGFPYPPQNEAALSEWMETPQDQINPYYTIKAAIAAVAALLTSDPRDPLQELLLIDVMLEQQQQRRQK